MYIARGWARENKNDKTGEEREGEGDGGVKAEALSSGTDSPSPSFSSLTVSRCQA